MATLFVRHTVADYTAWRKAYDEMRAKYTVLLPASPDVKSPPAPAAPRPEQSPGPSGEGAS